MRGRIFGWWACFPLIVLLLAGCQGAARMETVIINDKAEQSTTNDELSVFEVKTIYPVMEGRADNLWPLGWGKDNALIALGAGDNNLSSKVVQSVPPYTSSSKLRVESESIYLYENLVALSPDGQKLAIPIIENDSFSLKLFSIDSENSQLIHSFTKETLRSARLSWSGNSRYLSYIDDNSDEQHTRIGVYDTVAGTTRWYSLPQEVRNPKVYGTVLAAQLSDDGEHAAIVKYEGNQSILVIGQLSDGQFRSQYEHATTKDGWAEWIHQDQIAFVGSDANLYTYDQRNASVSILLREIGLVRLSQDRKFIAFTQDGDALYVARLYGNNLISMTQIYRGVFPMQMAWSLDDSKLLLSGSKPYEWDQPRPEVAISKGIQHMVIEFK